MGLWRRLTLAGWSNKGTTRGRYIEQQIDNHKNNNGHDIESCQIPELRQADTDLDVGC